MVRRLTNRSELIEEYINLLVYAGNKHNLVGSTDRVRIKEELVAESLQSWVFAKEQGFFLDVGSGAGFPGIVWGICAKAEGIVSRETKDEILGILCEPREKRKAFLDMVISRLNLSLRTTVSRLEDIHETYPTVTARAVFPPRDVLHKLSRVCRHRIIQSGSELEPSIPDGWRLADVAEATGGKAWIIREYVPVASIQ